MRALVDFPPVVRDQYERAPAIGTGRGLSTGETKSRKREEKAASCAQTPISASSIAHAHARKRAPPRYQH